jgi:hypothetical protein
MLHSLFWDPFLRAVVAVETDVDFDDVASERIK